MKIVGVSKSRAVAEDRVIALLPGLPPIPERLLLAHARGEVLFICGAGISQPAGMPDFRGLVLDIYESLDASVHAVLSKLPRSACNQWEADCSGLRDHQKAEVKRFIAGDYDVVLGMLERRLENRARGDSNVRSKVAHRLHSGTKKPAEIHRSMMRLADRGGRIAIVTTNFDLLLEAAAKKVGPRVVTYALGAIPRPSRQAEFAGVLHIHGALDPNPARYSELVMSDQDFGEYYLRRRVVPDFIYDAARLYHLVLVGYSANDPPMRYLLNAVAADGSRFDDLKERFTFFGSEASDTVALEDWRGRGITPIPYEATDQHAQLGATLKAWARLSAVNGKREAVDAELRRIVRQQWDMAPEADRDLLEHFFRRSNTSERVRMAALASEARADIGWLEAVSRVAAEPERRQTR